MKLSKPFLSLANVLVKMYYIPMQSRTNRQKHSFLGFFTTNTRKPNYYNNDNFTLYTDINTHPFLAITLLLSSIFFSFLTPSIIQVIAESVKPNASQLEYACIVQVLSTAITVLVQFLIIFGFRDYFKHFFKGRFKKYSTSVIFLLLMFIGIYAGQIVFSLLSEYIINHVNDPSPSISLLASNQTTIEAMLLSDYQGLMALTVILLAPISEEITFRLALQGSLVKVPKSIRILISSIIFGLIHVNFTSTSGAALVEEFAVLPIYVASGFFLSYTFARTESILPGIAIHSAINLIGVVGIIG